MIALLLLMLLMPSVGLAATASWDAVVDPDLQGYNLYRAPGTCTTPGGLPGDFVKIQSYGIVTTGPIPNPATNGTYCHRLTAFNPAGESAFSNSVEFKYVVVPPTAPQNLIVK